MSESEDTDIIPSPTSIVHAPTDITTMNSSLAKTAIPSQDSLAKVTYYKLDLDTILDGLIPDPLPESGGKDNAIHHLNIIIFGKPNTGKCLTGDDVVPHLLVPSSMSAISTRGSKCFQLMSTSGWLRTK